MKKYFLRCELFLAVEVKKKLTTWKSDGQIRLLKTNLRFAFITDSTSQGRGEQLLIQIQPKKH